MNFVFSGYPLKRPFGTRLWSGEILCVDFYCFFLLWNASLSKCVNGFGFLGNAKCRTNYGLLFTAGGFPGVLGPTIGGVLLDKYRNYGAVFDAAAALSQVALTYALLARQPSPQECQ